MRQSALMIERQPGLPAMPGNGRATHYLQPGFLHIAERTTITTILGSCVAICLCDSTRQIGGMNHFLLPRGSAAPGLETRFGEHAVPVLIQRLLAAGASQTRLQAKVFGGACANGTFQRPDHLGLKNVEVALDLLSAFRIAVVSRDVGGTRGRKLLFHTDDGTAMVKYL